MKIINKHFTPFLLILVSFFLLFFMDKPIPAIIFLLLGIVMIIEMIWPEKWETDKIKSC